MRVLSDFLTLVCTTLSCLNAPRTILCKLSGYKIVPETRSQSKELAKNCCKLWLKPSGFLLPGIMKVGIGDCLFLGLRSGWRRTRSRQVLDVMLWASSYELPDNIAGRSACIQLDAYSYKVSSFKCFAGNFLEKAKPRCLE